MSKGKHVKVIQESNSGRNQKFVDTKTNTTMTRAEFAKQIDNGNYPDYHTRTINKVKTPVSNPDGKDGNNLG